MGKFIEKYLLLIFLLVNLTAEYVMLMPISKAFFYLVMGISTMFMFSKKLLSQKSIVIFFPLFILAGCLVCYELLTSPENTNLGTHIYVIAKCFSFVMVVVAIRSDFNFYATKFPLYFACIAMFLILAGLILRPMTFNGRLGYGFCNPNAASAIAAVAFASIIFFGDFSKKTLFVGGIICFLAVLGGGSRNAMGLCLLAILMRYGITKQLFLIGVLLLSGVFILPHLGLEVTAFDRLTGTVTGEVALDRENQRAAAMWMISERPWWGWGFGAQMEGKAAELSEYGAHNGYLDMLMQMGCVFGGSWILVLIGVAAPILLKYCHDNNLYLRYHSFVVLGIMLAANQESYLIGVNQIITSLYFLSLAILLAAKKVKQGNLHRNVYEL